jgi:hypothetical protein
MVADRAPSNQAISLASWADQQNQQRDDDRDRGTSQVLSPDVLCQIDHAFVRQPVGDKQNIADQQDQPDEPQHNYFSNCQSHCSTLSNKLIFSTPKIARLLGKRKSFLAKNRGIDVSGARGRTWSQKISLDASFFLPRDALQPTKMTHQPGVLLRIGLQVLDGQEHAGSWPSVQEAGIFLRRSNPRGGNLPR